MTLGWKILVSRLPLLKNIADFLLEVPSLILQGCREHVAQRSLREHANIRICVTYVPLFAVQSNNVLSGEEGLSSNCTRDHHLFTRTSC